MIKDGYGFGINVMATTKCNMNCKYCKQKKSNDYIKPEQLRKALKKLINEKKFYPHFVTISGGEVLTLGNKIVNELFRVIEDECFFSVRVLNTNGYGTIEDYLSLKQSDVGCIFFSLDDVNNNEKINKIKNIKESGYFKVKLNHVYKNEENLIKLLKIANELDVYCQIMTNVHSKTRELDFEKNIKLVQKKLIGKTEIISKNDDHCTLCSYSTNNNIQRVIVKNGIFLNNTMNFILPNGEITTDFNKILTGEY